MGEGGEARLGVREVRGEMLAGSVSCACIAVPCACSDTSPGEAGRSFVKLAAVGLKREDIDVLGEGGDRRVSYIAALMA